MAKVKLDNLGITISQILDEYGEEVSANMADVVQRVGKAGVQAIKSESRDKFGTTSKRSKKYANTWTVSNTRGRAYSTAVIYNTQSGLPHLLENGHVSRNGTGRTFGHVPGREHIAPVEREIERMFTEEVQKL